MSFDALSERLTTLQETTSHVKALIDRLATLDFRPGSVPLPQGSDAEDDEGVATELSAEINQTLREEEEELELLAEEATDLRGGKEGSEPARRKERLLEGVKRIDGEVKRCRIAFHKAQLSARDSLAAARRLERQLLLQSYTRAASTPATRSGATSPAPSTTTTLGPRRRHTTHRAGAGGGGPRATTTTDDPVVAASSDLTQSLHRAAQLVQEELARSMTLHETLEEGTANLKTLDSTYSRVGGMLSNSGQLLGVLMKSTKSDTWYLETTFWMLAAVLGWLVFRRFLYGPMWWLVWLPLRIVFRTGSGAVAIVGGKGAARMEVVDGSGKRVEVDMGSQGTVPTAKVGAKEERVAEADPESLVDKIGQIVEMGDDKDSGAAEVFVPADGGEEVIQEDARVRDEL